MNFNMVYSIFDFIGIVIFITICLLGLACLLVASGKLLIDYYFKTKEDYLTRLSEDTLRRIVQQDETRAN